MTIRQFTECLVIHYTFEAAGVTGLISQAFASLRQGGKAVVVGEPGMEEQVTVPEASMPLEEKSLIGSMYMHHGTHNLLELYLEKWIELDELSSQTISLDKLNDAFDPMEKGEGIRSKKVITLLP